jgi:hypothetical protein
MAPKGTVEGVPYKCNLKTTASAKRFVMANAGNKFNSG